jgi:hypothetical protein
MVIFPQLCQCQLGIHKLWLVGGLETWIFMTFHILGSSQSQLTSDEVISFSGVETTNQLWFLTKLGDDDVMLMFFGLCRFIDSYFFQWFKSGILMWLPPWRYVPKLEPSLRRGFLSFHLNHNLSQEFHWRLIGKHSCGTWSIEWFDDLPKYM